jgi:lipopolysaccharide export system permease protein
MRDQYEKRGDIERIEPGRFQESAGGQRVFFVEKNVGPDRLGNNIFIATQENGKETMTSARHGRIHMQGQQRVLSLSNGQRLERDLGKGDLKISEFAHYSIQIDSDALSEDAPGAVNTRSTLALLAKRSAVNLAELSWRIGLVVSALNFIVLAVALAKVNPRAGRSFNLLLSLLVFVVYENLLNLGHSWIAAGQLNAWVFTVGLHGGVLLLGLLWLAKEQHNLSWRNLFKMRAMFSRGAVS